MMEFSKIGIPELQIIADYLLQNKSNMNRLYPTLEI
jgi:hypothetical protein